jgi:hypothetical protein
MKRAFLLVSMWCSGTALAQGFQLGGDQPSQPPMVEAQQEFDERQPVQAQEMAAGDGQWQPVPPPPPTDQEIEQNPMVNETSEPPAQAPTQQQFEQALTPYGQWVDDPNVGRVWQPDPNEVGQDFTPYSTGGTWGYNDYGWNFNTGWSWGWAPFHYGRWYRHASYGWVWYPGYTWGPSWVDWRYSGGYVGWAPLGPPGYSAQFGLGVPGWSFCARNNFWHPYVSYHQIYPRFAGGRYSWYHAPTYRQAPAWHSVSRSWNAPAWHNAAPWHGGTHAYASSGAFHNSVTYRSRPSAVRVGGAHSSGGHFGGGGHSGGGHHR